MDNPQTLTHLEARVLAAIERHIRAEGVAPTIAELAANLRLKSKGTVHRYVQSLIAKGKLERHGNGWRGLRIVGLAMPRQPSNVQHLPTPVNRGKAGKPATLSHLKPESNVSHPVALPAELSAALKAQNQDAKAVDGNDEAAALSNLRIPLLGRIAADMRYG